MLLAYFVLLALSRFVIYYDTPSLPSPSHFPCSVTMTLSPPLYRPRSPKFSPPPLIPSLYLPNFTPHHFNTTLHLPKVLFFSPLNIRHMLSSSRMCLNCVTRVPSVSLPNKHPSLFPHLLSSFLPLVHTFFPSSSEFRGMAR